MMKKKVKPSSDDGRRTVSILVWDIPTRLFHWLIVALVAASFVSAKIGGNAMQYHEWSGVTIIALLVFRIVWGFFGSQPSRFEDFMKGPAAVWRYAEGLVKGNPVSYLGHNPLGGWSVLAMLLVLMLQACLGLFANDDIITEGPLYMWVNKETSDWLTKIHRLNQYVLMGLVAIHLFAVAFHYYVKRENLLKPMITGIKHWAGDNDVPAIVSAWPAAVVAVLAGCGVYLLIY
ncbi:MAG: cytochrome b/b6 domain-containing protein [Desulfobacterales bacterium]|jgi:cytochrome b